MEGTVAKPQTQHDYYTSEPVKDFIQRRVSSLEVQATCGFFNHEDVKRDLASVFSMEEVVSESSFYFIVLVLLPAVSDAFTKSHCGGRYSSVRCSINCVLQDASVAFHGFNSGTDCW